MIANFRAGDRTFEQFLAMNAFSRSLSKYLNSLDRDEAISIITTRDKYGYDLLVYGLFSGDANTLNVLISFAKDKVNAPIPLDAIMDDLSNPTPRHPMNPKHDNRGDTLMHLAVHLDVDENVFRVLLNAGADIHALDANNKRPSDLTWNLPQIGNNFFQSRKSNKYQTVREMMFWYF